MNRRGLLSGAAYVLGATQANAFGLGKLGRKFGSLGHLGGAGNTPVGPTPGAHAAAFLARTSGLSTTERNAYINLINGLDTDGTFSLLDVLYIFATNNTTTAALNLISTNFTIVPHGTLTFTADMGWAGDGSTGYLDTTFNPTTATSPNYTLTSATFAIYNQTSPGKSNGGGTGINGSSFSQIVLGGAGSTSVNINDGSSFSGTPGSNRKAFTLTRNGTAVSMYLNGSATAFVGGSSTTTSIQNLSFFIGAINQNGSPVIPTSDQMSAAYFGAGVTGAQAAAINNRINTYMASMTTPVNVY
jgi:hypothetical protein